MTRIATQSRIVKTTVAPFPVEFDSPEQYAAALEAHDLAERIAAVPYVMTATVEQTSAFIDAIENRDHA